MNLISKDTYKEEPTWMRYSHKDRVKPVSILIASDYFRIIASDLVEETILQNLGLFIILLTHTFGLGVREDLGEFMGKWNNCSSNCTFPL